MEFNFNVNLRIEMPKSKLNNSFSSKKTSGFEKGQRPKADPIQEDRIQNQKNQKKNEKIKVPPFRNAPQNPFLLRIKALLFAMDEKQCMKIQDADQPQRGSIQDIKLQKQSIKKSYSQEQLVGRGRIKLVEGIRKSNFSLDGMKKSVILAKRQNK